MKNLLCVLTLTATGISAVAVAEAVPSQNPFKRPTLFESQAKPANVKFAVSDVDLPVVRATLTGGEQPLALIAGQVLAVGDSVDGFKLVAVREGVAVFERNGSRAEVTVKQQSASGEAQEEHTYVD